MYTASCALLLLFSAASAAEAYSRPYEWGWFLYERDRTGAYPSTMVTPFWFTSSEGSVRYSASLPPFLFSKYESGNSISRSWLLGLAGDVDFLHAESGQMDYDLGVVPFLLYGKSKEDRDRYLFVWPVGGTFRGKLAMDYVSPWGFPFGIALALLFPPTSLHSALVMLPLYAAASVVPVYAHYGRGDYEARAILWPLIQWGKSETRDEFRILPFYSHNSKKGWYDNRTWGLFVSYGRTFLQNGREEDTFMVFPLFARRWSNDGVSGGASLLWPFFSWGYNKKMGDLEVNFPWPLFVYQRSEKPFIRKTVLFPFYGSIRYEKDYTKFITPLYISISRDNDTFRSDYTIVGLLFWYFTRDYKDSPSPYYGKTWEFVKLWPLFRWESNDRGDVHFTALSLLPFRDPAAYDKIYDPLWSLVEYHRVDNVRRFGLLMRTYYQCWDGTFFSMKIPLVVSYDSYKGSLVRLTFLAGMFGYEKRADGAYMRVFWYPARIGEGDPSLALREALDEPVSLARDVYRPAMDGDYRYVSFSKAVF